MALRVPVPVRRGVRALMVVAVLLVLLGATYQGVATALERREFARPGGLVDVGGHQLHILCTGEGDPMVVLEAAAGAASPAWGLVQPALSRWTRVCSYDRAALAWSEAGDGGYVPERVPGELHALLEAAGERGPFILVGHELGGAFTRMYAARYPGDVAALVGIVEAGGIGDAPFAGAWPWLARAGILRASGTLAELADGLPGRAGGAMRAFLNRPDHLTRAALELETAAEVARAAPPPPPGMPAVSLTVRGHGRPAFITAAGDADALTRAVVEVVARVRAAESSEARLRPASMHGSLRRASLAQ